MKKPFAKLAAILAVVFIALGLTAPSAIAAAYAPSTQATISESATVGGSGDVTVTLNNKDVTLGYHLEVNGAPYGVSFAITGPGSETVAYSGLKAGDILSVAYDNYVFQSFTISAPRVTVISTLPSYAVTPARCVGDQNVEGTLTVTSVAHVTSRIGGEIGTSFSGYGPVSLDFIAEAGYTFTTGQLVSVTPTPNLGSVQNCTPPDTDGDKVADVSDRCSSTPAGEAVDINGCSDSQKDSDGDGVMNNIDQCPNTLAGVAVNNVGCPLPTDQLVVPVKPTQTDHAIEIPDVPGVIYYNAKGVVLPSGTWGVGSARVGPFNPDVDGNLVIHPGAALGYKLPDSTLSWTFHYGQPKPADNVDTQKVWICHATGDHNSPYDYTEVSVASIVHEHGHASHDSDIIPDLAYIEGGVAKTFPGLNYDTHGQMTLNRNHCNSAVVIPNPSETPTPPESPAPIQVPVTTPAPVAAVPTPIQAAVQQNVATERQPVEGVTTPTNRDHYVQTAVDSGYSLNWMEVGGVFAVISAMVAMCAAVRVRRARQ